MEPITISIFLISIAGSAASMFIGGRMFPEIFVNSRKGLTSLYRNTFENHDFAIFGGRGSGKTSLNLFLTTGRPYQIGKDGEIIPPSPTSGVVFVGESVSKNLKFSKLSNRDRSLIDVPGEFLDGWKESIEKVNPHGIIYMIDARLPEEDISDTMENLFTVVLQCYRTDKRKLRAIHIFLNFADQLNSEQKRKVNFLVTKKYDSRRGDPNFKNIKEIKSLVTLMHLSPEETCWDEAMQALEDFGTHIREVN
jgi:Signal recognition particle receptor beta subunit